jgi:hypothetical protein
MIKGDMVVCEVGTEGDAVWCSISWLEAFPSAPTEGRSRFLHMPAEPSTAVIDFVSDQGDEGEQ